MARTSDDHSLGGTAESSNLDTRPWSTRNLGLWPRTLSARITLSLTLLTRVLAQDEAETPIPLVISNGCSEVIWPGIGTQNGIGPGTGGFALSPATSMQMYVSPDWQGRIWGRTNCSFNADGTGPSNLNGVNGNGAACLTGDCFGRLDCKFTVCLRQRLEAP